MHAHIHFICRLIFDVAVMLYFGKGKHYLMSKKEYLTKTDHPPRIEWAVKSALDFAPQCEMPENIIAEQN